MKPFPALLVGILLGATLFFLATKLMKSPSSETEDAPGKDRNPAFSVDSVFNVASNSNEKVKPGENRYFCMEISKGQLDTLKNKGNFKQLMFSFANDDTKKPRNSFLKGYVQDSLNTGPLTDMPNFNPIKKPFPRLFKNVEAELGMLYISRRRIDSLITALNGKTYIAFRLVPTQNSPIACEGYLVASDGTQVGGSIMLNPCPPAKPGEITD